ncbi:hypothetical protein V8C86DRAFT_2718635 [Haematococcus lacustris]
MHLESCGQEGCSGGRSSTSSTLFRASLGELSVDAFMLQSSDPCLLPVTEAQSERCCIGRWWEAQPAGPRPRSRLGAFAVWVRLHRNVQSCSRIPCPHTSGALRKDGHTSPPRHMQHGTCISSYCCAPWVCPMARHSATGAVERLLHGRKAAIEDSVVGQTPIAASQCISYSCANVESGYLEAAGAAGESVCGRGVVGNTDAGRPLHYSQGEVVLGTGTCIAAHTCKGSCATPPPIAWAKCVSIVMGKEFHGSQTC